jgi:hypothetical protein
VGALSNIISFKIKYTGQNFVTELMSCKPATAIYKKRISNNAEKLTK